MRVCFRCHRPRAEGVVCASCARAERRDRWWAALGLVIILAAATCGVLVKVAAYDWTWSCLFVECRKVIP